MARAVCADPPHQPRQVADDRAERPSARSRRGRTGVFSPSALQMMAADADKLDSAGRSSAEARERDRRRADRRIPRRRRWPCAAACRRRSSAVLLGRPTTKRPSASASRADRLDSRGPASGRPRRRCRPARPRVPRSTVSGPIVGRSARNSWPGLAHLTITPRFLPASRPCERSSLTRASRPSVPSMPSSAMARPPIATAAWPISSAPMALAAANAAAMILAVGGRRLRPGHDAVAGQQVRHDLDARRRPSSPPSSMSATMALQQCRCRPWRAPRRRAAASSATRGSGAAASAVAADRCRRPARHG